MGDAIFRTHGKTYEVGQSRDVVGYAAGGTTEDYAYHPEAGLDIPYAWVYELRFDVFDDEFGAFSRSLFWQAENSFEIRAALISVTSQNYTSA